MSELDGHVVLVQEHAAGKPIVGRWRPKLKQKGWNMHMSPIGNKARGTGVGVLFREPIQAIPISTPTVVQEIWLCQLI